jgi:hypothetical protein
MRQRVSRSIALLSLLVGLVACGEAKRPSFERGAADYAGGETSEFSGGSVPLGYCPIEESRTALDLERDDIASWLALATGHHSIDLRWRKAFPDAAIRGFEETTTLSLDVTPISADDVVCRTGGAGGYEAEGVDGRVQRRFELGIELSTADGAVQAAFPARFFPLRDGNDAGRRILVGGIGQLPFADVAGTLELGVDPALFGATQTLSVQLTFDGQAPHGTIEPWVTLRYVGSSTPRWSPVTATFPAPAAGCDVGSLIPLDEPYEPIGVTPRAAYEELRALFPEGPVTGAWLDELEGPVEPGDLPWADVTLRAGEPRHACAPGDGAGIHIYTTLRIETADGRVRAEPSVVANIGGLSANRPRELTSSMTSTSGWMPRPEFEASAAVPELELGRAEYAAFNLYQTLSTADDQLQGELRLVKWEDYRERWVDKPALRWCAGPQCERQWCMQATVDEARGL